MNNSETASMHGLSTSILAAALASTALVSAAAAPDQTQGVALLSANVSSTGAVEQAAGVVSVVPLQTGAKALQFSRPVIGCALVASVRAKLINPTISVVAAIVTVSPIVNVPDTVIVTTRSASTTVPQNLPFSLVVFCTE
jgi:hypothetical protein